MFKNIYRLFSIISILAILILTGCDSNVSTPITTETGSPTGTTNSPSNSITPYPNPPTTTFPPTETQIVFSPMPKLGELSEVTVVPRYTVEFENQNDTRLANSKAQLYFFWTDIRGSYSDAKKSTLIPANEVVVKGQASWEGNARSSFDLHCTIKLPKDGLWKIGAELTDMDNKVITAGAERIVVADGMSLKLNSNALYESSLSYLKNFSYGQISNKVLDEKWSPVILVLDIAKAPKVGETTIVTCTITSLHDVADFTMKSDFSKRLPDNSGIPISKNRVLIEGDLVWQGNLKAGESVILTASIQFPDDGDWEIYVYGNSQANELNQKIGYSDTLQMNIGINRSSYGWETRYLPAKSGTATHTLTPNTPTPPNFPPQPYPTTTTPTPLIQVEVSFPNGAPPLNQTAELVCTIQTHHIPVMNVGMQVHLPDTLELISGDLSWFGDILPDSRITVIKVSIKSTRLGNYPIDIISSMNPEENGGYHGGYYPVYVAISENSAEWRMYVPFVVISPITVTPGGKVPPLPVITVTVTSSS